MTAAGCRFRDSCPVPDPSEALSGKALTTHTYPSGSGFRRVYDTKYGFGGYNPGRGSSRFAPIERKGHHVPTMYGAQSYEAALLETVFHGVHDQLADRRIPISFLRNRGLGQLRTPEPLIFVDLRDQTLATLGLERSQVVSTTAAHYVCTQEWSAFIHDATNGPNSPCHGIVWHSRQAELTRASQQEVFILFGDRLPQDRDHFELEGSGVRNLVEEEGRVQVEEIAEKLGAVIVHEQ